MAYNALNNLIDAYIYANGVQAITGQILNGVLKQMVAQLGSGYHLMGVATPETAPEQNDYAMAYFAATAGEYTDFGGITLAAGEVAVLLTSGNGSWSKQTIYTVPTTTEDLENTAGFITNTVTDLVNYYTKTEIDTTLEDYTTLEALATALADYYTKTQIDGQKAETDAALADRYTKSETDTKLADYYRKAETYDKDEVDSIVAALSRQEYIVAWDGLAAPDEAAIPAGVTVTYSGTTYTGTLAASASTVNKIYMVWNGTAYDMYGTSQDGGYSWVPMGTTTVDLSQYATKEEVSQLDAEINGHAVTTFTDGVIKVSDGSVGSATNRQYTDYIDVSGMSTITYTRPKSTSAGPTWGMAFYDENKVYISGISAHGGDAEAGYYVYTGNVPATAKYARFTRYSDPDVGDFWVKLEESYDERISNLETKTEEVGEKYDELENKVDEKADTVDSVEDSDLDISDMNGNVLVSFGGGHIKTKYFDSETIGEQIILKDNDDADLNIADPQGNVILRLDGGNIETKKFNSGKIAPLFLDKFNGVKIGIVGDSISTFSGWLPSDIPGYDGTPYVTYYPEGDVNSVEKTWWYKLAIALGLNPDTDISNCSWSGSRVTGNSTSTTSASAGCSTRRISDLSARGFNPDIILCFISCNDWGNNVAIGNWQTNDAIPSEGNITQFRSAFALMLYKIHETYPSARVFCCTNLDDRKRDAVGGWPTNNGNGISTDQWNENIIQISRAMGCDVINLHECGINYANILNYVVDTGLHPNSEGHTMIARKVIAELFAKY